MKRNLVVAAILAQPWALMPEYMKPMAGVIARWQAGAEPSADVIAKIDEDRQARSAAAAQPRAGGGSIAVINVFGTLTQRGNMMDELCGGSASAEQLVAQLRSAEEDNTVSQILLNFNTPGGSVYGIQEAAAEINRIKAAKPIVGIANSLCASAGYWLASQCSELYVTPGGEVGSIGVWQAHEDVSQALQEAGVKVTLVSAGKFKTECNPYQPLDDDAKAFMQLRTDQYYDQFVRAVAKGRGVGVDSVRDGMGQGRVLGAKDAMDENMVDGVMSMDDVVKKMQRAGKSGGSGARGASAETFLDSTGAEHPVEAIAQATLNAIEPEAAAVDFAAAAAARSREIELLSL